MKKTVFYSWQSDLPNSTNRSLIESALREASTEIATDETVGIDPVIDRDTLGSAGAPDIATTIFKKIVDADLFFADVSFVANTRKRSFPNPNVLIELGYALHAKGHEALILVFNKASGRLEDLPFDLKMRRILTYELPEGSENRAVVKAELVRDFKSAMLVGFATTGRPIAEASIIGIIEQNPPNKIIQLRKHLDTLLKEIISLEPKMFRDGGTAEELIASIAATEVLVLSFGQLAETVALMNDASSAEEIFQWFGKVLEKYDPLPNASSRTSEVDGDFYKFIGHELFIMFVTPLYREGKLDILTNVLSEELKVGPNRSQRRATKEIWQTLREYSRLLTEQGQKTQRKSLHADILKNRHTDGLLATVSPFTEFMEVDFLLHLHGKGDSVPGEYRGRWYPNSILYADNHLPEFVTESKNRPYATRLCKVLGINIEEFKRRLESSRKLGYDWHSPIRDEDIKAVGTEGITKIIA